MRYRLQDSGRRLEVRAGDIRTTERAMPWLVRFTVQQVNPPCFGKEVKKWLGAQNQPPQDLVYN